MDSIIIKDLEVDAHIGVTESERKQAQQALDNGDTDGAHGLALKAKLLLDELTKP